MITNVERLRTQGNESARIFVDTIDRLMTSQGFYSSLVTHINNMDEATFIAFKTTIEAENFRDVIDVIMWLEDSDI